MDPSNNRHIWFDCKGFQATNVDLIFFPFVSLISQVNLTLCFMGSVLHGNAEREVDSGTSWISTFFFGLELTSTCDWKAIGSRKEFIAMQERVTRNLRTLLKDYNKTRGGPSYHDALPSPGVNPLEGPTMCNCRKVGLEGRSRLPALKRGRRAC